MKPLDITISFWEREYYSEDRSGTTVRGYEPAIVVVNGQRTRARVIEPENLRKANFEHTKWFELDVPLVNSEFDLNPYLEANDNGRIWLSRFRKLTRQYWQEEIPLNFSLKISEYPELLFYDIMPEDYFQRNEKARHYRIPEGVLTKDTLSKLKIPFQIIRPPMKLRDGSFMRGIYYNRQIRANNPIFDSYSIRASGDLSARGIQECLLGVLREEDLKEKKGDFENAFPIDHYLEVCYPVSLRDAIRFNPMSIKVELKREPVN